MNTHSVAGTVVVVMLTLAGPAAAQERVARWQRQTQATPPPVTVFHATQSANLPTAETLRRGEWLFEVSHRFLPPVSGGGNALWGLDGPVFNRLGLAYAVSDRAMIGLLRSNLTDNLEVGGKVRILEGGRDAIPFMLAVNAGLAWNTELPDAPGFEDSETQAYLQAVANALVGGKLALGVVPTLLRNPRIQDPEVETAIALGLNAQLYLTPQMSLLAEWVVSERRQDLEHDAGTFGVELETGGHFFKLLLTNSARMNPTQLLGGTPFRFSADEWRLGFNITRLISLGR